MSYQHIQVTPISGACGAEISGIDLSQDIDEQRMGEVKRAFHENLVVFFRGQNLTEDQHKAFGRKFGTLNIHPRYEPLEGHPEIFPIRKDPDHKNNIGDVWHQDLTHLEEPPLGSILYALEVPPYGGDTMFANQYSAYEALSELPLRSVVGANSAPEVVNGHSSVLLSKVDGLHFCNSGRKKVPRTLRL